MKPREPRKPLTIPAQIITDGAPVNVTIHNVSSQGMMISGAVLPPPGSYVEVIRGNLALAGRVVWSAANFCGLRTQASIDDIVLKRGCFKEPEICETRVANLGAKHSILSWNLAADERSPALLRELQRIHAKLADAILALDHLLCLGKADRGALADIRLRLTKASGERLKLIETEIYPYLEQRVSTFDRAILEQLRNESFSLRATSTKHVAAWSIDGVVENWSGYSRASAEIRSAMRRRVEKEKAVLYPLLQIGSAASTADASFSANTYRQVG